MKKLQASLVIRPPMTAGLYEAGKTLSTSEYRELQKKVLHEQVRRLLLNRPPRPRKTRGLSWVGPFTSLEVER